MVAQRKRVCKCGRPAMQGMSQCGRCYAQAYKRGEVRYVREHRHRMTAAGEAYCRRHPNTETFDLTPYTEQEQRRLILTDAGRRVLAELEESEA